MNREKTLRSREYSGGAWDLREAPTEPPRRKPDYIQTVKDVLDRAKARKDYEFLHAVACDLLHALETAHAEMATYEMARPSDYKEGDDGLTEKRRKK